MRFPRVQWSHQAEIREALDRDRARILAHVEANPGATTKETKIALDLGGARPWLIVAVLVREGKLRKDGQRLFRAEARDKSNAR